MAIDLSQLARGYLHYAVRESALDDVRFDRIRAGFGAHYHLFQDGPDSFRFERGEGYLRAGRLDAFALVDDGLVERVREKPRALEGNVIAFAAPGGWLRFTLNLRTTFFVWAFVLLFGWFGIGGDWLLWLCAVIAIWAATIITVQISLRRKITAWMAPQSWN